MVTECTVCLKKIATICIICAPLFDKKTCHTLMVCLCICAGSAGYGIAALFAKHAAVQGLRCFTRRRTAVRPSKCGDHGARKVSHITQCFQVPLFFVSFFLMRTVYR